MGPTIPLGRITYSHSPLRSNGSASLKRGYLSILSAVGFPKEQIDMKKKKRNIIGSFSALLRTRIWTQNITGTSFNTGIFFLSPVLFCFWLEVPIPCPVAPFRDKKQGPRTSLFFNGRDKMSFWHILSKNYQRHETCGLQGSVVGRSYKTAAAFMYI